MRSPSDLSAKAPIIDKTVLLLAAMALNALEIFLPRIPLFPWLKPGLANCITIVWIVRYGMVDALVFTLLRSWVVGFYFGFAILPLFLGMSGGLASTLVMGIIWRTAGRRGLIGSVGIGVAGALSHNITQIAVVYILLARNINLFMQMPIMLFASTLFGSLVGIIAPSVDRRALNIPPSLPRTAAVPGMRTTTGESIPALLVIAASIAIVFLDDLRVLAAVAVIVTLAIQVITGGSLSALTKPATRFWLLFVSIAALHLFFSYGKRVEALPYITYEGLAGAAVQILRLWTWLQLSLILTRLRFHRVFFGLLQHFFRRRQSTLYAGMLALEYFPLITSLPRVPGRALLAYAARHPLISARRALDTSLRMVIDVVGRAQEQAADGEVLR